VVSSELRIGSLERWVSVGLWLLDTVRLSIQLSMYSGLRLRERCPRDGCNGKYSFKGMRTRSCGSS